MARKPDQSPAEASFTQAAFAEPVMDGLRRQRAALGTKATVFTGNRRVVPAALYEQLAEAQSAVEARLETLRPIWEEAEHDVTGFGLLVHARDVQRMAEAAVDPDQRADCMVVFQQAMTQYRDYQAGVYHPND